ncbi:putative zinc-type alcohol dehydrogenase-like protein C2E1P3.01, partial [Melanomma pulvis-pyrius CBS 109.77]
QVVTLLPTDAWPRKDVEAIAVLAYTTFGEAFSIFGIEFPPMTSHFNFGVKFWKQCSEPLTSGQINTHPVALRSGGLSGIPNG